MKIEMPWGNEKLSIEVPDTWHLHFPERQSNTVRIPRDELEPVKEALKKPINSKPLSAYMLKDKKILIIVDDNTRPTPVSKFFHMIMQELKKPARDSTLKSSS